MLLLINGVCVRHNKFERHQKEVIWFHNTHRSMEVVFLNSLKKNFWRRVTIIAKDGGRSLLLQPTRQRSWWPAATNTQVQKLKGSCNNEGKLLLLFEPSGLLTDFAQKYFSEGRIRSFLVFLNKREIFDLDYGHCLSHKLKTVLIGVNIFVR